VEPGELEPGGLAPVPVQAAMNVGSGKRSDSVRGRPRIRSCDRGANAGVGVRWVLLVSGYNRLRVVSLRRRERIILQEI
jgi:hypothetical protein